MVTSVLELEREIPVDERPRDEHSARRVDMLDAPTIDTTDDEAVAVPEPMTQRRVLGLATPIIGENLLQTLVGAVDTFMVARLGAAAVAGVGMGFELVFFIISILSAIDIGATVLVSQAIGASDQRRANHLARQAIVWGLILAIPVSLGMFLAAPTVIGLFGAEADVAAAATEYLQVIAATAVALFLSFVCGAILRGAGDSRTPLAAAVLANIVNVGVAYVLIFGHFGMPALGVAGSAFGAATGRAVGAAYMLFAMASGRKAISLKGSWGWAPRFASARQLLTLGVPAATEQVLSAGAFTTLLAVVALVGTEALAAQQITFTALSLAFLPAFGFSIAATALVGQSIGARVPADARTASRIALRWALVWMGIGGALAFLFSERVMGIFSGDPLVIGAGASALKALSIALPFWALWFVSSGSLRGSGDTRTPLVIGASTMWLSVLIAWVAVTRFGAGLGMIWLSFVLTTAPASLLMWWAYRQRIGEYEQGRRAFPEVGAVAAH
ncbi:MAG: efflux family protein [Thermomicrobiales bacterium]|jgi:multidrug resistance protein, MATE family|nr:efflux family protein [Thermomicrobiales bacterium]